MNRILCCPLPDSLQSLVDGCLAAEEQARLTEHLETCETCQDRLEGSAAGAELWALAAEHLRQHEAIPAGVLQELLSSMSHPPSLTQPEEVGTDDVPLDFLEPAERPEQLGRLGAYEVLEVLGRGGMGVVLKAFDSKLRRTVAIKVLAPHLASSRAARARFVHEAQAAAGIRNDHVIDIHAVDDGGPLPYLVMEHIPGGALQQLLERDGPLSPAEIARIGYQAARGLAAAHAQGLIHRDIKPANLLLDRDQRIKITDFGLARAVDDASGSQQGVIAGTPEYMAPEQARGEAVDQRADLFSLGSVLYALGTGSAPFTAGNTPAVLRRVCEDQPFPIKALNPGVPDWLIAIIGKLHAKDPAERFQTATEVADALQPHVENGQSATLFAGRRQRPWWLIGAAAAFLVALLAVLPEIIIRIRDKDGKVTEHKVGDGGSVEITENGQLVATAPGTVRTSTNYRRFMGHGEPVHSVAFSFDSKRVLSGGWDSKARLWDIEGGRELHCFDFWEKGKRHDVFSVATSPDGRRALAGAKGGRVWLLDLEARKVLRHCDHPEKNSFGANSMAFSPDGRQALLGSYDGVVRVWDVDEWKELERFQMPALLWSVDHSPVGRKALTSGGTRAGQGFLCLWDLNAPKEPRPLEGTEPIQKGYWRAVFSPDGRFAASAGGDNLMRLWDLTTAKEVRSFPHPNQVAGVSFTPDGRKLVSGCYDGIVRLWDVNTGKELQRFAGHSMGVQSVAVSRDGRYAVSGGIDRTVQVWELPK